MEIIILLILIVFFLFYLNGSVRNQEAIQRLHQKLNLTSKEISELKERLKAQESPPPVPQQTPPPVKEPLPEFKERPKPIPQKEEERPIETNIPGQQNPLPQPAYLWEKTARPVTESIFQKWWKANPDLEKFIGENLVNKIGIAILVLGVAFFVKYAIDKEWINELGRVCIGLACGAGLVALAHYLRISYRSFSSVLAGGGIAIFYFTIAFAFHQYALISQTAAFLLMVVITAFGVLLSVLYDKKELAVIAAAGGFLTPFLVSNGEGNYMVLFTYLIILNAGLLTLSYFKRWPFINILSLLFTVIITGAWITNELVYPSGKVSYPFALLLITVLYLVFLGMNMVYQLRHKKEFKALDFSMLLFLTASYYAAGMILLQQVNAGGYQGLFTLCSGLLNLVLAWYFFKREKADRNLLYLLIGLTLSFISLAIPVQLHGHAITLFWCAEFVLLYWLYQRSQIKLFRLFSFLLLIFTVISMLMDWSQAFAASTSDLALIYTNIQGIVTNLVAITAFAVYGVLVRKEARERYYLPGLKNQWIGWTSFIAAGLILYATCIFGVNLYFRQEHSYYLPNVYHRMIAFLFAMALISWLRTKQTTTAAWLQLLVCAICLPYYFLSIPQIQGLRAGIISGHYANIHLVMHWLADILLGFIFFNSIRVIREQPGEFSESKPLLTWMISLLLVVFFSCELAHVYILAGRGRTGIDNLMEDYQKAGLTILWALCSFVLMWLGMRFRNKTLRIISLSIFSVALLKLFFLDLQDISEGGKIAAFILLGALLLTISFMYQKLKKIIISDEV